MAESNNCQLCGEPLPAGEEMFNYHGYSGSCPKPPLVRETPSSPVEGLRRLSARLRADAESGAALIKPYLTATADALDVEIAQLEEQMQEDLARNRTGEAAPERPVHADPSTSDIPRLDDELSGFLAAFHRVPDRATLLRRWPERTFDEVVLLRAFCTLKPSPVAEAADLRARIVWLTGYTTRLETDRTAALGESDHAEASTSAVQPENILRLLRLWLTECPEAKTHTLSRRQVVGLTSSSCAQCAELAQQITDIGNELWAEYAASPTWGSAQQFAVTEFRQRLQARIAQCERERAEKGTQ